MPPARVKISSYPAGEAPSRAVFSASSSDVALSTVFLVFHLQMLRYQDSFFGKFCRIGAIKTLFLANSAELVLSRLCFWQILQN